MSTEPLTLPNQMLVAIPDDGSPPLALATQDRCAFAAHLRQLGLDTDHCTIGTVRIAAAQFVISWDRTVAADIVPPHAATFRPHVAG